MALDTPFSSGRTGWAPPGPGVLGLPLGDDTVPALAVGTLWLGIPLGGVALMIATILFIAFYADRANRDGALALSDDLLATLEQRIGIEVSAYLEPAARVVRILRDTLHDGALGDQLPLVETLASSLLREIPQIANLNFADSNGTSRTFAFSPAPQVLNSMSVFSPEPGTLTLSDDAGQTCTREVTTGSMQLVTTGWTRPSTTVTVSFTAGWALGVDDIAYTTAP